MVTAFVLSVEGGDFFTCTRRFENEESAKQWIAESAPRELRLPNGIDSWAIFDGELLDYADKAH